MAFSAFLFDLDGTLVDSISLYGKAVMQALADIGIEMPPEEFRRTYLQPLHLGGILAMYGHTEDQVPGVRARRDEIYIDLLRSSAEWLPGGQSLMTDLSARKDTPLGLITGSWMTYVDAIDSKLDVKRFFPTIVTADDIHRFMKPHPHGLLLAADRLQVDPKDCLYIGDQLFDIHAAHAAGMTCWLIHGTFTPDEALKEADRVFESPEEVRRALEDLA